MSKKESIDSRAAKSPYELFTEQQIKEAFEVFNEDRKGKAKLKHLRTILSALGRVPSMNELQDLELKVADPEDPGYMKLEEFIPPLTTILMEDKWKSSTKKDLITAFKVLDKNRQGFIEKEYMKTILLQNCDKSEEEDVKKFLEFAVNNSSDTVNYKSIVEELVAPQAIDVAESRRSIREKLVDDRYRLG